MKTVTWMTQCPFPEPPTYLDGHTASWVGTRLYLIAGGTYPEGHNPDGSFALSCSEFVYILETNPPCNADGTIPPLIWRKLKLVMETQDDLDEYQMAAEDLNDLLEDDEQFDDQDAHDDDDGEDEDDELDEDGDFFEDDEEDWDINRNNDGDDHIRSSDDSFGSNSMDVDANSSVPAFNNTSAPPTIGGIHPRIARALHAASTQFRRLLPRFGLGPPTGPDARPLPGVGHWNNNNNTSSSPSSSHTANQGEESLGSPYLKPRVWHSATVVGTRIYILAGRDMHLRYFGDVTYFDTISERFARVKLAPYSPKLPPRAAHGAVCPDDRHIYIFGGRYKYPTPHKGLTHKHYNDVWVFDTRRNTWKLLINPPETDPSKYMILPNQLRYQLATDEQSDDEDGADHSNEGGRATSDETSTKRKPKLAEDYPAPRCCFVMVLDPDLPHKAHIVGGYTSSNVCFYYIGDAWTLDLLELSWTPMRFLPDSMHLNRISIHAPTAYHDLLLLFAGEGSIDVPEVPYGSQQFLPHTTIFQLPNTTTADVIRYRDPVAYNYYQLSLRKDLADVAIELPGGHVQYLHRVVIAARMKSLNRLLSTQGEITERKALSSSSSALAASTSSMSSSSSSLRSSQRFSARTFNISPTIWANFLTETMPNFFFETFDRRFDEGIVSQAFLFAYTDTLHHIHRLSLDELVQLYHLGMLLDLKRLAAVALEEIAENLDPYFPRLFELPLIAELIASTVHFTAELSLIDILLWYHRNSSAAGMRTFLTETTPSSSSSSDSSSNSTGVFNSQLEPSTSGSKALSPSSSSSNIHSATSSSSSAITITKHIAIPVIKNYSYIRPMCGIRDVAVAWLKHGGSFATLSEAMDNLYTSMSEVSTSNESEADFELLVETSSSLSTVPSSSSPTSSSTSAAAPSSSSTSSFFPPMVSHPIPVHKSILIFSSPYLKGLLSHGFQETELGFATVQAPYPMDRASLDALIQFMYGGSVKHIQDKNTALDILCNIQFFYSQKQELLKPLPHLGQRSTRMLRPRSLEIELMTHCIDVVLSGEVSESEIADLLDLAKSFVLVQFEERLMKYSASKARSHSTAAWH